MVDLNRLKHSQRGQKDIKIRPHFVCRTKDCLLDKPRKMSSTMNHSKFNEHPGKVWGAKKQCEVLLRDTEAEVWSVENGEVSEMGMDNEGLSDEGTTGKCNRFTP